MLNMSRSLGLNSIHRIVLNELIDVQKSHQKIIGYALNHDGTGITLFTHAPVDYTIIKELAEKLTTPYSEATPSKLAQSIDQINDAYRGVLKNNLLHTMVSSEGLSLIEGRYTPGKIRAQFPFEQILWNRNTEVIDRRSPHPLGYSLTYVHGHDSSSTHLLEPNVFCLDADSGKSLESFSGGSNPVLHLKNHFLSVRGLETRKLLSSLNPAGYEEAFKNISASLRDILLFNQPYLDEKEARMGFTEELKFYISALNYECVSVDVFCQKSLALLNEHQAYLSSFQNTLPTWESLLQKLSVDLTCLSAVISSKEKRPNPPERLPVLFAPKPFRSHSQRLFFWDVPLDDEGDEPLDSPPPLPDGAAEEDDQNVFTF